MRCWWWFGVAACGRLDFDSTEPANVELVVAAVSWTDADAACKAAGGHLATVGDAGENAALAVLAARVPFDPSITNTNQRQRTWLGGSDTQGAWQWVTDETFAYSNWRMNEPSMNGEHCLIILGSQAGLWDNRACDFVADGYLCELLP